MNLIHPLKYHYYSYRKPYLIYLVIFIISLFLAPLLLDNLNDFYYFYPISIILVTLGFTIINSIYEFTILITHYFKIKTIKYEFYVASILYSLINSLIQTILLLISYFVIKMYHPSINSIFNFTYVSVYTFTLLMHLGIYSLIGLISLILKKVKFVQTLLYLVLLLIVALVSFEITNSVIDFIHKLYNNLNILIRVQPIAIITTIILWLGINYKINRIYN